MPPGLQVLPSGCQPSHSAQRYVMYHGRALPVAVQESTESAAMLSSSSREGAQGTVIYTYDYKVVPPPLIPHVWVVIIWLMCTGHVCPHACHFLTDALRLQIDTTRGKKRIVSTVAIKGRKLYICNGTVKCSAPGLDCDPVGGPGTVEAVEAVSQSFDVL